MAFKKESEAVFGDCIVDQDVEDVVINVLKNYVLISEGWR